MAKPRPYTTYYSDGTVGRASTARGAAVRAVKHVLDGTSRSAQVCCPLNKVILEAEKGRRDIHIYVARPKELE